MPEPFTVKALIEAIEALEQTADKPILLSEPLFLLPPAREGFRWEIRGDQAFEIPRLP